MQETETISPEATEGQAIGAAPVEQEMPTKIPVWGSKNLLGKPQMMDVKKAMENITNKGDIVEDPATGENVYLLRIYRGRRLFYAKARIPSES